MSLSIDEALERIYVEGTGVWTCRCTTILTLMSTVGALETNLSPFIAVCASGSGSEAIMNSAPFIGMLVGTLLLVPLADSFGRWRVLYLSSAAGAIFAFLSAAAMSYWQLLLGRILVGYFGATWILAVDLLEEYVTPANRGLLATMTNIGWGIGAVFINLLAWWAIPQLGWRCFVALAAVPYALMSGFIWLYLVESPRWLLAEGRHDEALEAVRYVASVNGCVVPCGQLQASPCAAFLGLPSTNPATERRKRDNLDLVWDAIAGFTDLLNTESRFMTLAVWGIWVSWNFAYNAIVIITDLMRSDDPRVDGSCSFDYATLSSISTAEVIGPLFVLPFIDRNDLGWFGGRLGMQAIPYVVAAIAALLLGMQVSPVFMWVFLARGFIGAGSGTSIAQAPELYDTKHRATGTGAASLAGGVGAIIAPCLVYGHSLQMSSLYVAAALLFCTGLLLVLPETATTVLDES